MRSHRTASETMTGINYQTPYPDQIRMGGPVTTGLADAGIVPRTLSSPHPLLLVFRSC
jgi:hypothetical protein